MSFKVHTNRLTGAGKVVVGEVGVSDGAVHGDSQVLAGTRCALHEREAHSGAGRVAAIGVGVEGTDDAASGCLASIEWPGAGEDGRSEDGGDGGKLHVEV